MSNGAEPDDDPATSASSATDSVGPPTAAVGGWDGTAAVGPPTAAVGAPTAAVGAPTAAVAGAGSGAGRASRPSRRGTGRTPATGPTRGQLGAGLVDVPPVPVVDQSAC